MKHFKLIFLILLFASALFGQRPDQFPVDNSPADSDALYTQERVTGVLTPRKFPLPDLRAYYDPKVVTTPITYVPATTGNTTNLIDFVTDPAGDVWYIDSDGNGIKLSASGGGGVADSLAGSMLISNDTIFRFDTLFNDAGGVITTLNDTVVIPSASTAPNIALDPNITINGGVVNDVQEAIDSLLGRVISIDTVSGGLGYAIRNNGVLIDTFPYVDYLTDISISASGDSIFYTDENGDIDTLLIAAGGTVAEGLTIDGTVIELGDETQNFAAAAFTSDRYINLDVNDIEFESDLGNNNPVLRLEGATGDVWMGADNNINAVSQDVFFFDKSKGSYYLGITNVTADFTTLGLRAISGGANVTSSGNVTFAFGSTLTSNSEHTAIFGNSNTMNRTAAGKNIMAGSGHAFTGDQNAIFGNNVDGTGNYNLFGGNTNAINGNANVGAGDNNTVTGSNNSVSSNASSITGSRNAMAGQGHTWIGSNNLLAGTNLATTTAAVNSSIISGSNTDYTNATAIGNIISAAISSTIADDMGGSLIGGDNHTLTDASESVIWGSGIDIDASAGTGSLVFAFGNNIEIRGSQNFTYANTDPGEIAYNNTNGGVYMSNKTVARVAATDGLYAQDGGIFAGINHNLQLNADRSVILGGNQIRPATVKTDMAYLPSLSLWDTPTDSGTAAGTYKVLYRDAADEGEVKTIDITLPGSNNLYGSDGTLSAARTLTSGGFNMLFDFGTHDLDFDHDIGLNMRYTSGASVTSVGLNPGGSFTGSVTDGTNTGSWSFSTLGQSLTAGTSTVSLTEDNVDFSSSAKLLHAVTSVTGATYTVLPADYFLEADANANNIIITLENAGLYADGTVVNEFMSLNNGTNTITLVSAGGNINGAATHVLAVGERGRLVVRGGNYFIY